LTKRPIIFRHILIWIVFITYEVAYVKFTVGVNASAFHFLIFYILNICLFYFNAHIILDFAFFKTSKPYLVAIFLIGLEIFGYLLLKFFLDYALAPSSKFFLILVKEDQKYILTNIWRGVYFIGFSIAYWSMLYMMRFKERNHHMETEQLKTVAKSLELENKYMSVENAYLHNQISPHLLFNSLNFIYNTVYQKSVEAGNGVMLLSELMRYSLVSADDTRTVMLSKEVKQLENLIALCEMRFNGQFYLRFKKSGKLSTAMIIPLVLITLVENIMKHGDMGDKKSPALISLMLKDNHLYFETRNIKTRTSLYPKGGLGLKNIEKRLSNYYHDKYNLFAKDENGLFIVTLTIDL
jgi:two-component system LytT family sensor kinase